MYSPMRRFLFVSFALLVALVAASSCSINEPEETVAASEIFHVRCSVADFELDEVATKVATTVSGSGTSATLTSTWEEGDVIGVFSDKGGDQVSFSVSEGAGTSVCEFDGHGWGLLTSSLYSAYYPFNVANYGDSNAYKSVMVSYLGQKQSNKGAFEVGDFDYLASTKASPYFEVANVGGSCTFDFKHLGALIILDVKFPSACVLSTLELVCTSNLFTEAGTVDLSQATAAITPAAMGNSLALDLGGMSVAANETVRFYMMSAPANLTEEMPTLKATTTAGKVMTKRLGESRNLRAGKAWQISAEFDAPQPPTLSATPASFMQDYRSQTISFRVTSNQSYTMTPTVSWLTKSSETTVSETVKEYTYQLKVNNTSSFRSGTINITGESLSTTVSVFQTGLTLHVPVAGEGLTIYTTTGNYKYRYGPSIIMNSEGTIDAWFSAPGHNGKADEFTWRRTSDGGQTWTSE